MILGILQIFYISNNIKATSAASVYQMAGQTPRNWQIDLPRTPIQAVASRASAMSIILEKARIHERSLAGFLSFIWFSLRLGRAIINIWFRQKSSSPRSRWTALPAVARNRLRMRLRLFRVHKENQWFLRS